MVDKSTTSGGNSVSVLTVTASGKLPNRLQSQQTQRHRQGISCPQRQTLVSVVPMGYVRRMTRSNA